MLLNPPYLQRCAVRQRCFSETTISNLHLFILDARLAFSYGSAWTGPQHTNTGNGLHFELQYWPVPLNNLDTTRLHLGHQLASSSCLSERITMCWIATTLWRQGKQFNQKLSTLPLIFYHRPNLQACLWRDALKFNVHPDIPKLSTGSKVADIATGTGFVPQPPISYSSADST